MKIKTINILAAVIVLLVFYSSPNAQNAAIKGVIINGTTGNSTTLEKITLTGFASGGMDSIGSLENISGEFVFSKLSPSGSMPYLIQADYKGVKYSSHVNIANDNEEISVEFTVYEPSNNEDLIKSEDPYVYFRYSGTGLEIIKRFWVKNENEKQYAFVNEAGTVRFYVHPENTGINFITVNTGTIPIEQEAIETEEEGIFAITYPIRPGVTEVIVSYSVPYANKSYTFEETLMYDSETIHFVAQPSSVSVTGEGIVSGGIDTQNNISVFTKEGISKADLIRVNVSGGTPVQQRQEQTGTVKWEHNRIFKSKWMLSLLIGVILIAAALFSRNSTPVKDERTLRIPKKQLQKKNKLLSETAMLDDRLANNDISKDEHKRSRTLLINQLVDLYKKQ
ncbi:MAG: hypothetical protein GY863_04960 [bacterium]|nr:hypothetical protein [bacterium]